MPMWTVDDVRNATGRQLPTFLLGGAPKCGTTTVYQLLKQHPQVFLPEQKEPFFFSFDERESKTALDPDFAEAVVWDQSRYETLYESAPGDSAAGDASTSYLYTADVTVKKLQSIYGSAAKNLAVIFVVRNPVDRAYSAYLHMVRSGHETLPFPDAIKPDVVLERVARRMWEFDYLGAGRYSKKLELFDSLGARQLVLPFEALLDQNALLNLVAEVIQIDKLKHVSPVWANPTGKPILPRLTRWLAEPSAARGFVRKMLPPRARARVRRWKSNVERRIITRDKLDGPLRWQLAEQFGDEIDLIEARLQMDLGSWRS